MYIYKHIFDKGKNKSWKSAENGVENTFLAGMRAGEGRHHNHYTMLQYRYFLLRHHL